MIAILEVGNTLTAVMSGAASSANPTYGVSWSENGGTNHVVGTLNGATAVTAVSAPTAGQRTVDSLTIYNRDTASVTVTIAKVVSGTSYTLRKVSLAAGATLEWSANGTRVVDSSGQVLQAVPSDSVTVGAAAGTGVASSETAQSSIVRKTVLNFTAVDVPLADEASTVAYGGLKIYDFPIGLICVLGATASLAVTKSSAGVNADWDGDFAIGSVTASNNGTLTSTEATVIPSTATPQAVSGATTAVGVSSGITYLDGHTAAADLFINFLVDDADHDVTGAACNLILNGTVTIFWIPMGDV